MKAPTQLQQKVVSLLTERPELTRTDIARICRTSQSYVSWIRQAHILHNAVPRVVKFKKPKRDKPAVLTRVKCLGPGDKEHYFMSPDPARIRICSNCRETIERISGYIETPYSIVSRGA